MNSLKTIFFQMTHARSPQKRHFTRQRLNLFRWIVVIVVALQSVAGALPAFAQGNSHAEAQSNNERSRLLLTLVGDAVGPNTVQLTLTATPLMDAPALQVSWEVGSGQMMGGPSAETLSAVAANSPAQQLRSVLLPGGGTYPLMATVTYEPYPGMQVGASTMLFALVDAQGAITLTPNDPNVTNPRDSILQATVTELAPEASIAGTEATDDDDPCFTITGTVTREERTNTQLGRIAAVQVPVRAARVEMREEDLVFDDSYDETVTDDAGHYSFSFCDDDGIFDDDLELYVRLRAELFRADRSVVEVTDSSWIDETYEWDSNIVESDGGTFDFSFALNGDQSAVFNIADAVMDAYMFWNRSGGAVDDDATFDEQTEVHWEPGYIEDSSYYNGDGSQNEITIKYSPADSDEWDDTVIMHEWGHFADDIYSCDDNPGGDHSLGDILGDPELAWGEAYQDYFQAAVRSALGVPDGRFYLDANNMGVEQFRWDLEKNILVNINSEDAIAAMLWDLADSANDGQDMTGVGHVIMQQIYTDPAFESNGDVIDDDCSVSAYLRAWKELGLPTDAATAASITQNIGLATPFDSVVTANAEMNIENAQVAGVQTTNATNQVGGAEEYVWWQQVTMVADNSASMVGPKFEAVKTVMTEQVNDLQGTPDGIEFGLYTFNNRQPGSQEVVRGRFYPEFILPSIEDLTTTNTPQGEVEPCKVNAFSALAAAIQDKSDGEAWVYTDGETNLGAGVEAMQQMLTTRGLHGSFVMMGGCSSPPDAHPAFYGVAHNFLGAAANGTQPSGIVPYLLTAIGSGGNFLFVNENQLADAGDILRAQLSHSAGAGRWSDYVSNSATYSWDKLTSHEYEWVNPAPADYRGVAVVNPLEIIIPPVTVFGDNFDKLYVNGDGFLTMGPLPQGPTTFDNTYYLSMLYADLGWETILAAQTSEATDAADTPDAGGYSQAVSATDTDEWVAITTEGRSISGEDRAYQVLLNKNTGEIRYQYKATPAGEAGEAEIGVTGAFPVAGITTEVIASNQDANGADPGTGYKFTPMPPQPTKTFTVPVDGLMSGVGFLLTGYSGTFAPMAVTAPDGTPVDCNQAGTLCLNLGLVQYVQTNVNGRNGDWHATVTPGNSGEGTFSFSAMGASAIKVEGPFSHQLALGVPSQLSIYLGGPAEGNQLTAWFQRPDGTPLGGHFMLYDDGAHGDGAAGDGKFGLADFMPPGEGVGYMWVQGKVNGVELKRSDASPYNFQPVNVVGPSEVPYLGTGLADIDYTITNLGDEFYCFEATLQMPDGWSAAWDIPAPVCLNPGAAATHRLHVTPPSLQDPAASRSSGEVIVTYHEQERGQIADSAATLLVRYNVPAEVAIENYTTSSYVRPNGSDTVAMTVLVVDDEGFPVVDGTVVELSSTLGSMTPAQGGTINGQLPVIFTSGNSEGDALVEAKVAGIAQAAQTVVHIQNALPDQLTFEVDPSDLIEGVFANMVATVLDQWGDPVAGQTIRIGVENDGENGIVAAVLTDQATSAEIQATDVVTLTSDAQGQVKASFSKQATGGGRVGVRAELLFDDGTGLHIALVERREIVLSAAGRFTVDVYLPTILDKE